MKLSEKPLNPSDRFCCCDEFAAVFERFAVFGGLSALKCFVDVLCSFGDFSG